LSIETALDRLKPGAGRLLIRGNAGSGKTTLMRWAAIEAAKRNYNFAPYVFISTSSGGGSVSRSLRDRMKVIGKEPPEFLEFPTPTASDSESAIVFNKWNPPTLLDLSDELWAVASTASLRDKVGRLLSAWRQRLPFLLLLRHCQDGRLPTPE